MSLLWKTVLFLTLISTATLAQGVDKRQSQITRIGDVKPTPLGARPSLITADTCLVWTGGDIVWQIDGWVTGNELYKAYMDPAQACGTTYPFTVTEIHIIMGFQAPTPLLISVDIEAVDNSTPGCPKPGQLLAISQEYQDQVPEAGIYDVYVPLDSPFVVNGPFFGGFFISNLLDPSVGAAVTTDSFPVACMSYNIWDETLGFVDLANNEFYNFPGRLALFATGIAGSSAPFPEVTILFPQDNDTIMGTSDLWVQEVSGSDIIDYVSFEFSNGAGYTEIGRDYDGASPFRDGQKSSLSGNGFSLPWTAPNISEGLYTIRCTAFDTLGRAASDSITVFIEPTPPTPTITMPANGQAFCDSVTILMSIVDENISWIEGHTKSAANNYSAGLTTLDQSAIGSVHAGPVAAAIALKLWADRGIIDLLKEGSSTLTTDALATRLATHMQTSENLGTSDENFLTGIRSYYSTKFVRPEIDYMRQPSYFDLRAWVEEEQRAVVLGIGGSIGSWLTVDGFNGFTQSDGTLLVRVSNPVGGIIQELPFRPTFSGSEISLNGTWQRVDIMFALTAPGWTVQRTSIGLDFVPGDGWSLKWSPSGLSEGSLHFIRTTGIDATGNRGYATVLLQYSCSGSYIAGDYNGDLKADISDLVLLLQFITLNSAPPIGGTARADSNCDQYVNIADIVYYLNFLFGSNGPPCN